MKSQIKNFKDLEVYQLAYQSAILVITELLPRLPKEERYDLKDQLSRSVKAVPRLIAEGYAKRHQNRGFQKYLDDALAESNETMVGLEQCKDIYGKYVDVSLCVRLLDNYDKISRQLYKLNSAWHKFYERRHRFPKNVSHFEAEADNTKRKI